MKQRAGAAKSSLVGSFPGTNPTVPSYENIYTNRLPEGVVPGIGILGLLVALVVALAGSSAWADDTGKRCYDSFNGGGQADGSSAQSDQLFTPDQCDALTKRELRLKLFEIPQEDEDPMSLSVGAKNMGGILRFRIPFSF
jgi:hypothetical protein